MSTQAVKELLDKFTPNAPNVTQHSMVVVDDSPLTVQLDGGTTNVQAVSLTGRLPVGTRGIAYWAPPLQPVVFVNTGTVTMQHGKVSITPSAPSTPTSFSLTFPVPFASTPTILTTAESTVPGTVVLGTSWSSASTTGCTLWLTRTNTTATNVCWQAVL